MGVTEFCSTCQHCQWFPESFVVIFTLPISLSCFPLSSPLLPPASLRLWFIISSQPCVSVSRYLAVCSVKAEVIQVTPLQMCTSYDRPVISVCVWHTQTCSHCVNESDKDEEEGDTFHVKLKWDYVTFCWAAILVKSNNYRRMAHWISLHFLRFSRVRCFKRNSTDFTHQSLFTGVGEALLHKAFCGSRGSCPESAKFE